MKYLTKSLFLSIAICIALSMVSSAVGERAQDQEGNYFSNPAVNYDFSAIDRHALGAPPSAKRSIKALAGYLGAPAKNDIEKARAVFVWITKNIRYNVAGLKSGNYGDNSAEGTLRSGTSVCAGYGSLYRALAVEMGLESTEISGYAKGYGYTTGEPASMRSNHNWNAVKIDGTWYLTDPTWGSGRMLGGGYDHSIDFYFFIVSPHEMIYSHYPDDPRWQLLETAIGRDDFFKMVNLRSEFFSMGFKADGMNHRDNTIHLDKNEHSIAFEGRPGSAILAHLKSGNNRIKNATFIESDSGKHMVRFRVPGNGEYYLEIFGRGPESKINRYNLMLEYKLHSKAPPSGGKTYPETFGRYGSSNSVLYAPLDGRLTARKSHSFRVKVPGAVEVVVINNGNWTRMEKREGDIFEAEVMIHPGKVELGSKFAENSSYDILGEFEGI